MRRRAAAHHEHHRPDDERAEPDRDHRARVRARLHGRGRRPSYRDARGGTALFKLPGLVELLLEPLVRRGMFRSSITDHCALSGPVTSRRRDLVNSYLSTC